ncbi:hypothetical protein KAS79_03710 [Candidatus Parcubacteria bacterium]|nr:hypothetical protein [Candidatus Parcubacteria bacterium]
MNKNQFQSILNKGIATPVALLIVFLVSVIAGGAILAYQHFQITEKEVETSPLITKDETADWKVYTNEEFGYEIKYPENWEKVQLDTADAYFSDAFALNPDVEWYYKGPNIKIESRAGRGTQQSFKEDMEIHASNPGFEINILDSSIEPILSKNQKQGYFITRTILDRPVVLGGTGEEFISHEAVFFQGVEQGVYSSRHTVNVYFTKVDSGLIDKILEEIIILKGRVGQPKG